MLPLGLTDAGVDDAVAIAEEGSHGDVGRPGGGAGDSTGGGTTGDTDNSVGDDGRDDRDHAP